MFGSGFNRSFLLSPDGGASGGDTSSTQEAEAQGEQAKAANKGITFQSQDELDELIEKRLARVRAKYERQLDDFGKAANKGAPSGERTYTQAEVEALISKEWSPKLEASNKRISQLLDVQRENAILVAASSAYDPRQIAKLVKDDIGFDDEGNLVVVDAKGNPRLGATGKPVRVEEHIAAFLEGNKHLVRGSGIAGIGSSTNNATAQGKGQGGKPGSMDAATAALAKALGGG